MFTVGFLLHYTLTEVFYMFLKATYFINDLKITFENTCP